MSTIKPTEENQELRREIEKINISSVELEDTHSCQITEALENLHTLSERHKAELAATKHEAQRKCKCYQCNPNLMHGAVRQEMEAKEKEIQDKIAEIKLLQREKAELERMRHTDIVKLRLEV